MAKKHDPRHKTSTTHTGITSVRTKKILAIIDDHPELPTRTVARMAYDRHPILFPDIESARSAVRLIRGARGSNRPASSSYRPRPKQAAGANHYPPLPAGREEVETFEPLRIAGPAAIGIIGDVHVRFHDVAATEIALAALAAENLDVLLLNGDIADFYECSKFETDPSICDPADSLQQTRQFLQHVRGRFPHARIVYKLGNHEERWARWLSRHPQQLRGIEEFQIENLLQLKECAIEMVSDCRRIVLGQGLNILHGHEYRFAISNPVNAARGLFLRGKTNALCNHFHQTSQHSEKSMEGKVLSTFSVGCLCQLHPQYHPYNNWNHGFAIVRVEASGGWHVQNLRIVDGRVW